MKTTTRSHASTPLECNVESYELLCYACLTKERLSTASSSLITLYGYFLNWLDLYCKSCMACLSVIPYPYFPVLVGPEGSSPLRTELGRTSMESSHSGKHWPAPQQVEAHLVPSGQSEFDVQSTSPSQKTLGQQNGAPSASTSQTQKFVPEQRGRVKSSHCQSTALASHTHEPLSIE
jgi:hypothetical protein